MKYYICYDISEDKIRDRVVKYLEAFAHRIQYSVFYCTLDEKKAVKVRGDLMRITQESETRLLLMVPVCKSCEGKIWMEGTPLESADKCVIV